MTVPDAGADEDSINEDGKGDKSNLVLCSTSYYGSKTLRRYDHEHRRATRTDTRGTHLPSFNWIAFDVKALRHPSRLEYRILKVAIISKSSFKFCLSVLCCCSPSTMSDFDPSSSPGRRPKVGHKRGFLLKWCVLLCAHHHHHHHRRSPRSFCASCLS